MSWILTTEDIHPENRHRVGGKGYALSLLTEGGFKIPETICVTSDAYHEYVKSPACVSASCWSSIAKTFKEMRWEEIWDCATRIRSMFLTKPHACRPGSNHSRAYR